MKLKTTFLAATGLAFSLMVAAPAFAQNYYAPPPAWHEHHHHWHPGEHFYGHPDFVHHWEHFHLAPPPYGFAWVRADHQFLLINVETGWIRDVAGW
jgi:hypothetical protein